MPEKTKFKFTIKGTIKTPEKMSIKQVEEMLWDMTNPFEDDDEYEFKFKSFKVTK